MTPTDSPFPPAGEDKVREHFRGQAVACEHMGSPFTAALCRLLADRLDRDTAVGRKVLGWPGSIVEDVVSLRLCGALHRLVLSGADDKLADAYPPHPLDMAVLADAVHDALTRFEADILAGLDGPPQTNEVARSAMLYPGFLTIARQFGMPLAIREIGSSAGLNQLFDRFRYRYDGKDAGDAASPVALEPQMREGGRPRLDGKLAIASRAGCDITPVDIADPAQQIRLRSFIWVDQQERMGRLDGAIALAKAGGIFVEKAGAGDFVARSLRERSAGKALVIFHSIMWKYMPADERARIEGLLATAGAASDAPLAWLRMEPIDAYDPYATLSLTMWPSGETRVLARCDYHGRWIEWLD